MINSQSTIFYTHGEEVKGTELKTNISAIPTGAILQKTNIVLPNTNTNATTKTSESFEDADEEQQDSTPETRLLQELATFDKITVYGHEVQPDAQEDVYVKGINEWIGLAGAVSCALFCADDWDLD
jgi:ribonuclease H2 subunit C